MKQSVILDTGPLVALLKRRDQFHPWSKRIIKDVSAPLLTCEPVIVETCFLLRDTYGGRDAVMSLLRKRHILIDFALDAYLEDVSRLIARYSSVPMSLADACLVKMAELNPSSDVMTLDSDFKIYRIHGNQVISVVMPDNNYP